MSFKINLSIVAIIMLTPLVISNTSIDIKLLTLYSTGIGVVLAVFYSAIGTIKTTSSVLNKFSIDWFLAYLAFGISVPSLVNLISMAHSLHALAIALLTSGFIVNDFYIVNKKDSFLVTSSILYGAGTTLPISIMLMKIPTWPDTVVGTVFMMICIIAIMGIVSGVVVSRLADKINLYRSR